MMQRVGLASAAVVSGALVASCFGPSWRQSLRTRAAFDLRCDADGLQLTQLGGDSYGVEGCGCRATYIDASGRAGWQWALNATSGTCVSAAATDVTTH